MRWDERRVEAWDNLTSDGSSSFLNLSNALKIAQIHWDRIRQMSGRCLQALQVNLC
jgi:hypothetical protein